MAADQDSGFEQPRKPTRREEFLQAMDAIVPWAALCQVIEPHYPKAGNEDCTADAEPLAATEYRKEKICPNRNTAPVTAP